MELKLYVQGGVDAPSHVRLSREADGAERCGFARCAGAFSSSWATIVPEPAPRPGPGQVLAPMCQSRSTGVRWPGRAPRTAARGSSGRARASRCTGRRGAGSGSRPGGRRARGHVRATIADSRFGMCRASRAWIRSAYRSRSSSVQVPSPVSSSPAASPFTCHGSSWSWIQRIPLPVGRPARIDRQRLAADDRRLGRQQPALGLVDRARDAVEPGRDVDDRRLRRAARRRSQRGGSESAKWICISERP